MSARVLSGLALGVICVAGCGASSSSDGNSAQRRKASPAQTQRAHRTGSAVACPLTTAQVDRVLRIHVSPFPGSPTGGNICAFGTPINGGKDIDLTKPGIAVYHYPQSGQPPTFQALRRHLSELGDKGIIDHSEWGQGAFADVAETTVLQIDVYVGSVHVLAFLPKSFAGSPEAIADGLGRLLAVSKHRG